MSTAVPTPIQVRKPHTFKRYYEFWQNEDLVAVVDYHTWFNKSAIVSIKDKKWKIKTGGFWKKHIEFTAEQSPYTKSRIDFRWNYRLFFSFDNRQIYNLKPIGFWRRTWAWHDDKDNVMIEIKSNQWSKKNRGKITLHQSPSDNLYFLMVLGWYQLLTYEDHSAAAASAA